MIRECCTFIFIFLTANVGIGHTTDVVWNGQVYDDQTVAKLITVITTTNPIPSIPTAKHLYPSQSSLFRIPAFALCKKIIVFDGVQRGYENRRSDYENYKKNVIRLTKTDPYFFDTELIFCSSWGHLSGAIKEAIKSVSTPFLFIHQHDFILQKDFDLNGLIATMVANPNIKHVRLTRGPTNTFFGKWDGPVDDLVEGIYFVPLCRCFGWSDNDHVTRLDYYKDFVLPKCKHGSMEAVLHPALQEALALFGMVGHKQFGTYLYGNLQDGNFIRHTDGRNDKSQ